MTPADGADRGDQGAVRVEDVVDQLDMLSEGIAVYLDLHTREFLTLFDPGIFGDVGEEDPDPEDLDPKRYAALPTSYEIHEWAILRDFCIDVDDSDLRERLMAALHGRGAFRTTKRLLYEHGLEHEWYAARQRALERIATAWLASLGLGPDADVPPDTGR